MAGEQLCNRGLNEGGGEAGLDRRHAAQERLEKHFRLGEVGDLRRAADDQGCAQQKILEDGTQERGGRDALGLGGEDVGEVGGGIALAAGLPQAVELRG